MNTHLFMFYCRGVDWGLLSAVFLTNAKFDYIISYIQI